MLIDSYAKIGRGLVKSCDAIRHPLLAICEYAVKKRMYDLHDWLLRHHEDQHRIAALKCVEAHIESYPELWVFHGTFVTPKRDYHHCVFVCEELNLFLTKGFSWFSAVLYDYSTGNWVISPQGWNRRLTHSYNDLVKRIEQEKEREQIEKRITFSKQIVSNVQKSHETRILASAQVPLLTAPVEAREKLEDEFKPSRDDCIETLSKAAAGILAVSKRDEGKAVQSRPSTGTRNTVRKPMERRKRRITIGLLN